MNIRYGVLTFMLLVSSTVANAQDFVEVEVAAGDVQGLREAIVTINEAGSGRVRIIPDAIGQTPEFVFTGGYQSTDNALPVITGDISINDDIGSSFVIFRVVEGFEGQIRFAEVSGMGSLSVVEGEINDFGTPTGSGGAILLTGDATARLDVCLLKNNVAAQNGGAIHVQDDADLTVVECGFRDNSANQNGGAISIAGRGRATIGVSRFQDNSAAAFGCAIDVNAAAAGDKENLILQRSTFLGPCPGVRVHNPLGTIRSEHNYFASGNEIIRSTDTVKLFANLFDLESTQAPTRAKGSDSGLEALCEDFSSGAFESLGYNIAADDSCALTQETDRPNTDPGVLLTNDGFPFLDSTSAALDAGASEALDNDGDGLRELPCGHKDVYGNGRPQDGDGDGDYQCDIGPMEVTGNGDVQAGHSGVFFHPERNGEGNYVEVLNDTTAVVYTFSYNPDGTGPAWFSGLGEIVGNSIIVDELQHPVGARFGDAFDPADLERQPAGSMSMVFNDCLAQDGGGGSVAYTGEPALGYEGLLSRATRLGGVAGCDFQPVERAGLSGSWYDPSRSGEGLIVQWFESGLLLAMFFTYAPDGSQYWTFGTNSNPPAEGPITLDAVSASAFTPWGSEFNANDAATDSWGTFTLEWDGCRDLSFSYDSSVAGFGSGTRSYQRLTSLQGTDCT